MAELADPPAIPEAGKIHCPKCHAPLPAPVPGADLNDVICGRCRGRLQTITFPRVRGIDPDRAIEKGAISTESDAVCRYFPELKAEKICDTCGCFLSSKAAVEHGSAVYCMPCLHAQRNKADSSNKAEDEEKFVRQKMIPDQLALSLALWGIPLSIFCAPIALYYLIRYRGPKHRGLVPRSGLRWWIALALALAQVAYWIFLFVIWVGLIRESML